MAARVRKTRQDPSQEELLQKKDKLNAEVTELIQLLIETKRAWNGKPAPRIGVTEPTSIKFPLPDQVEQAASKINQLADDIVQRIMDVDRFQDMYSQRRRKGKSEVEVPVMATAMTKEAKSNVLSRLWAHVTAPFQLGDKDRWTRLRMLRAATRLSSELKEIEDLSLTYDPEAVPEAIYRAKDFAIILQNDLIGPIESILDTNSSKIDKQVHDLEVKVREAEATGEKPLPPEGEPPESEPPTPKPPKPPKPTKPTTEEREKAQAQKRLERLKGIRSKPLSFYENKMVLKEFETPEGKKIPGWVAVHTVRKRDGILIGRFDEPDNPELGLRHGDKVELARDEVIDIGGKAPPWAVEPKAEKVPIKRLKLGEFFFEDPETIDKEVRSFRAHIDLLRETCNILYQNIERYVSRRGRRLSAVDHEARAQIQRLRNTVTSHLDAAEREAKKPVRLRNPKRLNQAEKYYKAAFKSYYDMVSIFTSRANIDAKADALVNAREEMDRLEGESIQGSERRKYLERKIRELSEERDESGRTHRMADQARAAQLHAERQRDEARAAREAVPLPVPTDDELSPILEDEEDETYEKPKAASIDDQLEKLASNLLSRWVKRQNVRLFGGKDKSIRLATDRELRATRAALNQLMSSLESSNVPGSELINRIQSVVEGLASTMLKMSDLGNMHNDATRIRKFKGKKGLPTISVHDINSLRRAARDAMVFASKIARYKDSVAHLNELQKSLA
jgi:hypothetical protein